MKKTLIILGAAAFLAACSSTSKETAVKSVDIKDAINPQLTYGKAYDVDSNEYKTITIGTQTWFAENLRSEKLNDGTPIAEVADNAAWASTQEAAYAAYNNEKPVSAHGLLYNYKALESENLCPEGWKVPSDEDWDKLIIQAGGQEIAATTLKSKALWKEGTATNESGFSALPSGFRERDGRFFIMGENALWWSTTVRMDKKNNLEDTHNGMYYSMDNNTNVNHSHIVRSVGLSVRCVKK
ncbi:MAG: lipoprotein [Bacteroidales bacterium]|jgi:uncharacterized protein (TIGR02145 family)|nr:lipoprotein [Bacteroidales bacterium]